MEKLRKEHYEVRTISRSVAYDLVSRYHYARSASNTAVYLHGLFEIGVKECLGVAWWLPPTKSAALATYPDNWQAVLALSRLVIVPGVPSNACSFLLSRSRRLIDSAKWKCLVTYADTWQGHSGAIYRADNWEYKGMTRPERCYVRQGIMIARKAGPKTRTHKEMLDLGCEMIGSFSKHKFVKLTR